MITRGITYPDDAIVTGPRIGITKAADWPLRWYVAESECVSAKARAKGQGPRAKGSARGRS
jgi:3-methyladenine DNA glycosylase Mpg